MEINVELIDHMGRDLSIVNAARVSLGKQSNELCVADEKLIHYLMKNKHGTPFEMVQFQFRVHVPIFVAREWQRHRIGSYNEMSSRYTEMPEEAYLPPLEDIRTQVGKPGHYVMESLSPVVAEKARSAMEAAYGLSWIAYKELLAMGVAKEVARNVLPLAQMTEFIWSVNLRSLFNFLSLRMAETALREIRYGAEQVYELSQPIAPTAFAAWNENGRIVP